MRQPTSKMVVKTKEFPKLRKIPTSLKTDSDSLEEDEIEFQELPLATDTDLSKETDS